MTEVRIATDSEVRARLRVAVRAPSGVAVLDVLRGHLGAPLPASAIARLGAVSTTSARQQAYRLACLGWAKQTTIAGSGGPTMAWQITARGLEYSAGPTTERRATNA